MRAVLEVHGEVQLDRQFVRWIAAAEDATPVWEEIYLYLLQAEQKQFESEGSYSGEAWVALAASTVARKQREGLRPEILRATDELFSSLTEIDDVNQLKVITPQMMAFGSTLSYAKLHQTGTSQMPQRRPIDLTEENKVAIMKGIQLWLARGMKPVIKI